MLRLRIPDFLVSLGEELCRLIERFMQPQV